MYGIEYYRQVAEGLSDECKRLVGYLEGTKFFIDPASNKYHHVREGGLADHSMQVYQNLVEFVKEAGLNFSDSTLFLIGIGHDLDKIGRYRSKWNNFAYIPKKRIAQYHGGNSFAILKEALGPEFENNPDYATIHLCIFTHMGDYGEKYPKAEFHKWKDEVPLVQLTFNADFKSCEDDNTKEG